MTSRLQVALPDIGDFKDVPVIELLAKPGDRIAVDDLLVSIESDKATMEVPSPVAGIVAEWLVAVGDRVSTGTPIVTVDVTGEAPGPVPAAPPAPEPPIPVPAPATPPAAAPPVPGTGGEVHASPSVRAYARELGVALDAVRPSGPAGRVLREDVQAFVRGAFDAPPTPQPASPAPAAPVPPAPAAPTPDPARFGPVRRESLSRIQQISGAVLARNWAQIPHVTNFDHADVTETEALRVALNGDARPGAAKITMVAFLIKASAVALRAFPRFNAVLDGADLILREYVHVGFAADTPRGLLVPVVRDADRKGLGQIADEMAVLAEKARAGTLAPAEMQGGSFSVSSLGGIGGDGFTPIINAPEVAILGAARSRIEPVWDGALFQPRLILPLSLSWDHRVVDGAAAARFLRHLATVLEDVRRAA
ncbi:2-oxo acid dehydrogenase subunit E2 [Methylobacterium oryzihabitans]|uniref:Dihydrolipoamide acetyltransferase component of pyruvate dehydrogenase complex n=1 Tax=Methylobacterium oryzihabitans TaxID=2499852 RepID=A0A437NV76_9HYPH|nr:2-oxo acid dehydrogenase subunit E2 [Methylobacterium oryzihabitans]RVU13897.1 branched-chain alpha-keto acid dehydrogenase subunit E2 [Methylobacterium oryzihabitans]